MKQLHLDDFEDLFLLKMPLIDVRSPNEFSLGSIPGAINLPLLTDDERHQIGLKYKLQGQDAAVALGHELVSGSVKQARLEAWLRQLDPRPSSVIYCFRGGLRSQIVQAWLKESGREVAIVEGGYKALRQFLIQSTESLSRTLQFQVVSGPTGSGKTDYLAASGQPYIDLEALAVHRGSAFGAMPEQQPTQIDFENRLAVDLMRAARQSAPILIEDESQQVGHRLIPAVLFQKMQSSPKLVLDVPIEARVEAILRDYVLNSKLGIEGDLSRFTDFRNSVRAISRKLGGARTKEILADLDAAQNEFEAKKTFATNRIWIRKLLEWYYDPFYDFALNRQRSMGSRNASP